MGRALPHNVAMSAKPRRFALLEAYESLTRKEGFCLGEGNAEGARQVQRKKAKILDELAALAREDPPSPEEKRAFEARIENLLRQEAAHAARLEELMAANREAYRKASRSNAAAAKLRRAYGSGGGSEGQPGAGGLSGEA